MGLYLVSDWLSGDVIKAFYTEEAREEWMDDNCEWFSDGCYIKDTTTKVYCERA